MRRWFGRVFSLRSAYESDDVRDGSALANESVERLIGGRRRSSAEDEGTLSDVLDVLSRDVDWRVRWRVARNRSTPPETLARLADDPDLTVRFWVAGNPNTDPAALERLAYDADVGVRVRVVCHLNVPIHVIERLAGDSQPRVARAAGAVLERLSRRVCIGSETGVLG